MLLDNLGTHEAFEALCLLSTSSILKSPLLRYPHIR